MGKKDKKSKTAKTAEQKARLAARQSKKASQKEKKGKAREVEDSDADDVDVESVLEQYAKQQAQFLKVTETPCEPPSPRSSATLIASPSSTKELFLYGGEYFNGALATFYGDLYVYHIDKDEWRKVTSPNSPLPRSGHAWCRGGNSGAIYLFGGEFSSPKQGTFYHYNDFWRLDPSTREWTRLETKGKGPPARSGHRLTYYKNYIILFGGFQDTSQQTKYLQDLWIYDCQNFVWHNPVLPPPSQKPDGRSSFSFHPHDAGAVIYGGYSRVKVNAAPGKHAKGGSHTSNPLLRPVLHEDTWFLRFSQNASIVKSSSTALVVPSVRWERRKKPANSPNPSRAGVTQTYHKGRGIMFGGVHDVEESEEGIESEFFDQLYAWNIERNRFFPLALRRARSVTKRQVEDRGKRGRGKADEAELLRNLASLEMKGSIATPDEPESDDEGQAIPDAPTRPAKPILNTMPHRRFNAQLTVQGDILYMFGGTYEQGDQEFTFDEMHSVDLGKLDGVQQIFKRELENWQCNDGESESDGDEEEESEDEELEGDKPAGVSLPAAIELETGMGEFSMEQDAQIEDDVEIQGLTVPDNRPQPRAFENLRQFFTRTSSSWQDLVLDKLRSEEGELDRSIKELRKVAFELAETKWWDCREEISAEEERQEEAGIGEVVNIADRTTEGGGSSRRR